MAITGTVKAVTGTVKAVTLDSITVTERTLQVGDQVQLGEQIITADGSSVVIEFSNGAVLDLGRNMETVLTAEMLTPEGAPATAEAPVSEEAAEAAEAEIEALQQAILEGKDPLELEATAAGPAAGPGGDGIHDFVIIKHIGGELNPDYGFHTTGPGFSAFHNPNTVDFPPEEEPPVVAEGEEPPDDGNGGDNGDGGDGGNGEEPPGVSTACLVTNTNSDGQIFDISVTSASDGRTSTATMTADKEGSQDDFEVTFDQGFEFVNGETYWVVIEYVSGEGHTNIRGFCLTDDNGREIVLNRAPGQPASGADDTFLGDGSGNTFNGVIYKISVDQNGDASVSEPVGYNLDNSALALNTVENGESFVLDFGQLSIEDDGQNLFGNVTVLDISGSQNEDNSITLSLKSVLDLSSSKILIVNGDTGDNVDTSGWTRDPSQDIAVTKGGGPNPKVETTHYAYTQDDATLKIDVDVLLNGQQQEASVT